MTKDENIWDDIPRALQSIRPRIIVDELGGVFPFIFAYYITATDWPLNEYIVGSIAPPYIEVYRLFSRFVHWLSHSYGVMALPAE